MDVPDEKPVPSMRIGDAEREDTIRGLERAMVAGHLNFDEMEDRMAAVYKAKTAADLVAVTRDLPTSIAAAPPVPTSQLGNTQFNLLGDIKRGGWLAVPTGVRAISLIGDVTLDLSSADLPAGGVDLTLVSLIGDLTVIVADGTPVHISTISLIGGRREAVTPALQGMPAVRIMAVALLGDVKVYSLSLVPEGRLRAWWGSVRRRAIGRRSSES